MNPPAPPSTWRATLWVAKKELITGFRDRQMAMYSVVLPICLYPAIFWIMIQGALLFQGRREHTSAQVGLTSAPGVSVPADLMESLSYGPGASELEDGDVPLEFLEIRLLEDSLDPESLARQLRADGSDPIDALLALGQDGPALIAFDSTEPLSKLAAKRLTERLEIYAEKTREDAAREQDLDPRVLEPIAIERRNLAPDKEMGAFVLSLLLPMLLVMMSVMGAFYPAVDLTAGERERGTSETTMILPIPRLAVHQGKILAVCASALLATSLNLLALAVSGSHLLKTVGQGMNLTIEIPFAAFLSIAPLALLFTFFVSAILTGVAALAKGFKEGQALLGPVQMLFIFPAMTSILPGLSLSTKIAFVPVVNVVMAFRSMLRGEAMPLEYSLTALSLFVYAGLAIAFAVRVLSRESLGVSQETIPLTSLFKFLRSDNSSR